MAVQTNDEIKGTEKEFLDLFNHLCYSRTAWQVWSDLMSAMACTIANVFETNPKRKADREKEYERCIKELGGDVEIPAKLFAIVTMALENNPDQDFLGKLYMQLNLGSHWHGQFFTPYDVCKMMSLITIGDTVRRGKMPCQISDERWFIYVDRQEEGFLLRYFKAWRHIKNDAMITGSICKKRIEETMHEYSRCFCTFSGKTMRKESYEWGVYHQKGNSRWIPDEGKIACMECILYPGNLPQAWEHTPMKYSALEILSQNIPTTAFRYEDAIDIYLKFPKLEWFCKMGLNQLAKDVVKGYNYSGNMTGKVNYKAGTIYEILGLNKVNTRTLQAIDGNHYELRLLQVAQQLDIQMKPEQLKEFYETFECNTDLLKEKNRKVSLHKLCRYIDRESERYPIGEKNTCMWNYSYNRYKERTDPRIERKQNMAHDWLEYIGWCRELKYDLENKFIYMPNNFKKVHDRVAEEYKVLQDKKAAAEKIRREKLAAKRMEQTQKAMEEIFSKNDGVDAFQIKGKGLVLVVPQSGDEIRKEGEALHHCVGGYVESVAKGETNIFFVRKADHPEKSYFTMEWKNNKVVQCRGKSNCGMPPDVKAFVQVFEKKMQDAIQKGDTNVKKKQNLQSA